LSVALVGVLLFAGCGDDGYSGPGRATLIWQDQHDSGSTLNPSRDVANDVATCDGHVFAVGESRLDGDPQEDTSRIRTYAATTGALVWEESVDGGSNDVADEVVCGSDIIVVGGQRGQTGILRAYRGSTGDFLWEAYADDGDENDITSVVIHGDEVFLAARSTVTSGTTPRTSIATRVLDLETGVEKWRNRVAVAAPWATALLDAGRDRVCTLTSDQGDGLVYSLRCLRRRNGDLAWRRSAGVADRIESQQIHFLPDGEVFVSSTVRDGATVLEAYASSDGTRLWRRSYPGLQTIVDIESSNGRVFVAGVEFMIEHLSDGDTRERDILFVEGRDPATGEAAWEHRVQDTQPRAIAVDGGDLVVAGVSWQSWVFDGASGDLLVDEPRPAEPPTRFMWDVAAEDGRYFLVGAFFASLDARDDLDFAVRAYAAR
jgi:hypothetical protein